MSWNLHIGAETHLLVTVAIRLGLASRSDLYFARCTLWQVEDIAVDTALNSTVDVRVVHVVLLDRVLLIDVPSSENNKDLSSRSCT